VSSEELKASVHNAMDIIFRLRSIIEAMGRVLQQDQLRLYSMALELIVCTLRDLCRHENVLGAVDKVGWREVTLIEQRSRINTVVVVVTHGCFQQGTLAQAGEHPCDAVIAEVGARRTDWGRTTGRRRHIIPDLGQEVFIKFGSARGRRRKRRVEGCLVLKVFHAVEVQNRAWG
jgi:hypothetical protein